MTQWKVRRNREDKRISRMKGWDNQQVTHDRKKKNLKMGSYRNILNHLHLKIYFPLSGYFRLVLAIIKSQEILEIVKKWQQTVPRKGKVYRILNTEIKKKCRKAKEEWLNENSTKIERMSKTKSASMYNCIKEWTGRKIETMNILYKTNGRIIDKENNTANVDRIRQVSFLLCEREMYNAWKYGWVRNIKNLE